MRDRKRVLHFLYTLLVLAILANGMYFWLQKSQVIPSEAYQRYVETIDHISEDTTYAEYRSARKRMFHGLYSVPNLWIATKLVKDVFFLVFLVLALVFWRQAVPPPSKALIIPTLLALVIAVGFCRSLIQYGAAVAILGLRPYVFLLVLYFGAWATFQESFGLLGRYLLLALMFELVLVVYENAYGLPLFTSIRAGNRVTGTFSMPASLGIFAVMAGAFAATFSRLNKWLLLAVVTPLVYLSGSGTAFVLLFVAVAMEGIRLAPAAWKRISQVAMLGLFVLLVLALPDATSRPDLYNSLFGRIGITEQYFDHPPGVATLLFGQGLGIGSNIVQSATTYAEFIETTLPRATADSTPMAMIHQVGLVGTALFYLLGAAAAWRDRRALPLFVLLFLAGMTVNLLEFFPVNFLLGILLCRSLVCQRTDRVS